MRMKSRGRAWQASLVVGTAQQISFVISSAKFRSYNGIQNGWITPCLGLGFHACNPNTWESEIGGAGVQSQP